MKFIRAEDDFETMLFHRHTSEDGSIEIGVYTVLFGFRIRAGMTGMGWCELDYCGGADQEMVERIYSAVLAILEKSDGPPNWDVFPIQARKPMGNDPECLMELERLAGSHERIKIRPLNSIREISMIITLRTTTQTNGSEHNGGNAIGHRTQESVGAHGIEDRHSSDRRREPVS